jgi:hypothetical protein
LALVVLVRRGLEEFLCFMRGKRFRCRCCKKLKLKRTADQRFCGDKQCQRARKNQWRREKYESDQDYRQNQRESTQAWLDAHGGCAAYHQHYRLRKRKLQQSTSDVSVSCAQSDAVPGKQTLTQLSEPEEVSAKSDGILTKNQMKSGRYRIIPDGTAKSDAILVTIEII